MFGKATHLMVNLSGCNKEKLIDSLYIKEFLDTMPSKIGMRLILESDPVYVATDETEQDGITGLAVLAESHISVHAFHNKGFAYVDVFSCKPFDTDKVLGIVKEAFDAQQVWYRSVDRSALFNGN